jgi:hypothetical protein
MKIRIKGNSIRIRLSKLEVKKLCNEKEISETTQFPNSIFTYKLMAKDINELAADYLENVMYVYFPERETLTWYDANLITYKGSMQLANGNNLSIIVEKDFVCLDHTDEDQSDNYPNPSTVC